MPIPIYDSPVWDQCVLGGSILPGISTVATGKQRKIDLQKVKGMDGAGLVDCGYELSTVTIINRSIDQHRADLDKIMDRLIVLKNSKIKSPIAISHPNTDLAKVAYVWIKDIKFTNPDKQIFTIQIECIEWVDPQPKAQSTKQVKPVNFNSNATNKVDAVKNVPDVKAYI